MPIPKVTSAALLLFALVFGATLRASAPASAHEAASWTPTPALVVDVEARLALPEGAAPMDSYGRYYYGKFKHGRRVLVGEFVQDLSPGVHIISPTHAPRILDGGCSVIRLVYDVAQKKVTALFCNGNA